jgi:hypothetical protein
VTESEDRVSRVEWDVRPTLGIGSGANELGLADCGGRMIKVKVRVVEKPEDEPPAVASARDVNALLCNPALFHEPNDKLGTGFTPS